MQPFDPETLDLAALAAELRTRCGRTVQGAVVGRTRLRDAVAVYLGCSMLEAEALVDTMIGRGFVVREQQPNGLEHWTLPD